MSSVENPSIAPIWARVSGGGVASLVGARLGSLGAGELPTVVVLVTEGAGAVVVVVVAEGAGFGAALGAAGVDEGGGGGGSGGGAPCSIAWLTCTLVITEIIDVIAAIALSVERRVKRVLDWGMRGRLVYVEAQV